MITGKEYYYTGYVRTWTESYIRQGEPMRVVCWGGETPCMLLARDDIAKYFRELFREQSAEAVLQMRFRYDRYCEIQAVEILDDAGEVIKTVTPGSTWQPFIGWEEEKTDEGTQNGDD